MQSTENIIETLERPDDSTLDTLKKIPIYENWPPSKHLSHAPSHMPENNSRAENGKTRNNKDPPESDNTLGSLTLRDITNSYNVSTKDCPIPELKSRRISQNYSNLSQFVKKTLGQSVFNYGKPDDKDNGNNHDDDFIVLCKDSHAISPIRARELRSAASAMNKTSPAHFKSGDCKNEMVVFPHFPEKNSNPHRRVVNVEETNPDQGNAGYTDYECDSEGREKYLITSLDSWGDFNSSPQKFQEMIGSPITNKDNILRIKNASPNQQDEQQKSDSTTTMSNSIWDNKFGKRFSALLPKDTTRIKSFIEYIGDGINKSINMNVAGQTLIFPLRHHVPNRKSMSTHEIKVNFGIEDNGNFIDRKNADKNNASKDSLYSNDIQLNEKSSNHNSDTDASWQTDWEEEEDRNEVHRHDEAPFNQNQRPNKKRVRNTAKFEARVTNIDTIGGKVDDHSDRVINGLELERENDNSLQTKNGGKNTTKSESPGRATFAHSQNPSNYSVRLKSDKSNLSNFFSSLTLRSKNPGRMNNGDMHENPESINIKSSKRKYLNQELIALFENKVTNFSSNAKTPSQESDIKNSGSMMTPGTKMESFKIPDSTDNARNLLNTPSIIPHEGIYDTRMAQSSIYSDYICLNDSKNNVTHNNTRDTKIKSKSFFEAFIAKKSAKKMDNLTLQTNHHSFDNFEDKFNFKPLRHHSSISNINNNMIGHNKEYNHVTHCTFAHRYRKNPNKVVRDNVSNSICDINTHFFTPNSLNLDMIARSKINGYSKLSRAQSANCLDDDAKPALPDSTQLKSLHLKNLAKPETPSIISPVRFNFIDSTTKNDEYTMTGQPKYQLFMSPPYYENYEQFRDYIIENYQRLNDPALLMVPINNYENVAKTDHVSYYQSSPLANPTTNDGSNFECGDKSDRFKKEDHFTVAKEKDCTRRAQKMQQYYEPNSLNNSVEKRQKNYEGPNSVILPTDPPNHDNVGILVNRNDMRNDDYREPENQFNRVSMLGEKDRYSANPFILNDKSTSSSSPDSRQKDVEKDSAISELSDTNSSSNSNSLQNNGRICEHKRYHANRNANSCNPGNTMTEICTLLKDKKNSSGNNSGLPHDNASFSTSAENSKESQYEVAPRVRTKVRRYTKDKQENANYKNVSPLDSYMNGMDARNAFSSTISEYESLSLRNSQVSQSLSGKNRSLSVHDINIGFSKLSTPTNNILNTSFGSVLNEIIRGDKGYSLSPYCDVSGANVDKDDEIKYYALASNYHKNKEIDQMSIQDKLSELASSIKARRAYQESLKVAQNKMNKKGIKKFLTLRQSNKDNRRLSVFDVSLTGDDPNRIINANDIDYPTYGTGRAPYIHPAYLSSIHMSTINKNQQTTKKHKSDICRSNMIDGRLLEDKYDHSNNIYWPKLHQVYDSHLLPKMPHQKIRLQEVFCELLVSEKSYLKKLNILVEHFCNCLDFDTNGEHPALSLQDKHYLFSNIKAIRGSSENFVRALTERWLQQGPIVDDICDLIIQHCQNGESGFEAYIKYCSNQTHQYKVLNFLKKNNSRFTKILKELESDAICQGVSMYTFLTLPIQKISHLPTLIKSIADMREPDTEEHLSAQIALRFIYNILSRCKSGAKHMERIETMINLSQNLTFKIKEIQVVSKNRYVIKQGDLTCLSFPEHMLSDVRNLNNKNVKKIRLHVILFNDLMLITKRKSDHIEVHDYCEKHYINIKDICHKGNLKMDPTINIFVIIMLKNYENKFYQLIIECLNRKEKENWLNAFKLIGDDIVVYPNNV